MQRRCPNARARSLTLQLNKMWNSNVVVHLLLFQCKHTSLWYLFYIWQLCAPTNKRHINHAPYILWYFVAYISTRAHTLTINAKSINFDFFYTCKHTHIQTVSQRVAVTIFLEKRLRRDKSQGYYGGVLLLFFSPRKKPMTETKLKRTKKYIIEMIVIAHRTAHYA